MIRAAVLLALSSSAVAEEPAPDPVPIERSDAQELTDEGWRRIELGDNEGARLLAVQARRRPGADHGELAYMEALSWAFAGDHDNALARLNDVLVVFPGHRRAGDAAFRIALVHDEAGHPSEARGALGALKPWKSLPLEAQHKVALCDAAWLIDIGRTRRGIRRLRNTMEDVTEGLTWYRARAVRSLLDLALDQAARLRFDGPERRFPKVLEARATLISAAEAQVALMIDLEEPEFVLRGLYQLGQAYEAVGDDLLAAPMPELSKNQLDIYQHEVARRAANQWIKASRYYDLGLEHAGSVHWEGPLLDQLVSAHAAVAARIEAGP